MKLLDAARQSRIQGFTLIELLVVISIIAFLMAALGAAVVFGIRDAKIAATEARIEELRNAVVQFSRAFKGHGVVPDQWGGPFGFREDPLDFELEDAFPSGKADEAEDRNSSSGFLAFWLGFKLRAWHRPNQDASWREAEAVDFGPYIPKLRAGDLGLSPSSQAGKADQREATEAFVKRMRNSWTKPIELIEPDAASGGESTLGGTPKPRIAIWNYAAPSDLQNQVDDIVIKDEWDHPLRYIVLPDEHTPHRFFILSAGPDGEWNTEDDLPKPLIVNGEETEYYTQFREDE